MVGNLRHQLQKNAFGGNLIYYEMLIFPKYGQKGMHLILQLKKKPKNWTDFVLFFRRPFLKPPNHVAELDHDKPHHD